jgi:hypothetical protein
VRSSASILALAIALLWGTGCVSTPGDCMIQATCAQSRLIRAGVDARIGIVDIDTQGQHAITVWRVSHRNLWIYDGQGSYESGAVDFGETNEIANTITRQYFLPTRWGRWVTP